MPVVGQERGRTRVALIGFDINPTVVANLTTFQSNQELIDKIDGLPRSGSKTVNAQL